jgi:hypothetical protein
VLLCLVLCWPLARLRLGGCFCLVLCCLLARLRLEVLLSGFAAALLVG